MSDYKISELYIYPIKSFPGISLSESEYFERGLRFDRRWMIVDNENMFMTQRYFPQMLFIEIKLENNFLILSHKKKKISDLKIALSEMPQEELQVTIWDDVCSAVQYGEEINSWLSSSLDYNCKLVYMPESSERKTSTKYYSKSKNVSFADGYPFLIIGEEALRKLNSKLNSIVTMSQFRPNIVFTGGEPHDEDKWSDIIIHKNDFTVVKPCARCVITTLDLETAAKSKEPLSTLSTYRNFNNKIMFGQNMISHSNGTIRVGDEITVKN